MNIKLKSIEMQNFINFNDFKIEFNDGITSLYGVNGSGKTTVGLTAILAAINGIAERAKLGQVVGERFHFIGPHKKTSDIIATVIDTDSNNAEITIRNHLSKAANAIVFDAEEGYDLNQEKFSNLLSFVFMSAKNFTALSSKEQAIALGIDTEKYDKEIKNIKDSYRILNRELKAYGELVAPEKVEKVSITELLREKSEIEDFNKEQEKLEKFVKEKEEALEGYYEEEARLVKELEEVRKTILKETLVLSRSEKPESLKSLDDVNLRIGNVEKTNEKALAYESYCSEKAKKEAKQKEIDINRNNLEKKEQEKIDYIKAFKLPFTNLSIDEDGGLLVSGRPLKPQYFSKGELEVIVAKLHASIDPIFKTRFIDDFESLDEDNQKDLLLKLTKAGFQVITSEVGKSKKGKNSFLLKESRLVESYGD